MTQSQSALWRDTLTFFESELFRAVQLAGLFPDSKTFADALPKTDWHNIERKYQRARQEADFSLSAFVDAHFVIPTPIELTATTRFSTAEAYIQNMWEVLTQSPDSASLSSLIPLPHPYIVPGGRFREIYYWDSYFTSLGLMISGHEALVVSMIENFLAIQEDVGCIPNGNRGYYISRSQPPILGLMYKLIKDLDLKPELHQRCREGIKKEYEFWMSGSEAVAANESVGRVVGMPDGSVLNRYFDSADTPRPESYLEDIESAGNRADSELFYRNLRAACESGWDFSSRWLDGGNKLDDICTTQIVPVDLNALLYDVECHLASLYADEPALATLYSNAATQRKTAMNRYLWNEEQGFFFDWHSEKKRTTGVWSLAATVPLFCGLATTQQAQAVSVNLDDFLCPGGVVTTLTTTSQQWDAPNGWAPLQWFAIQGLINYGCEVQATEIASRWVHCVDTYFEKHHAILEKYNVRQPGTAAGGGEYEVQLGFGWTNGVYLKCRALLATGNSQ